MKLLLVKILFSKESQKSYLIHRAYAQDDIIALAFVNSIYSPVYLAFAIKSGPFCRVFWPTKLDKKRLSGRHAK